MIDWEVVGALAIILVMLWIARSQGRSNPVSTGKLQEDIHTTKNKLQALEQQMNGCATREDVEKLRAEMKDNATSTEVADLKREVTVVCTKVEGMEKLASRTDEGVRRIEKMFIEKGINGK